MRQRPPVLPSPTQDAKVSITLAQDSWMAILETLRHACRLRGGGWIHWQREIDSIVMGALAEAKREAQEESRHRMSEPPKYLVPPGTPMKPEGSRWIFHQTGDVSLLGTGALSQICLILATSETQIEDMTAQLQPGLQHSPD